MHAHKWGGLHITTFKLLSLLFNSFLLFIIFVFLLAFLSCLIPYRITASYVTSLHSSAHTSTLPTPHSSLLVSLHSQTEEPWPHCLPILPIKTFPSLQGLCSNNYFLGLQCISFIFQLTGFLSSPTNIFKTPN